LGKVVRGVVLACIRRTSGCYMVHLLRRALTVYGNQRY
jgi:hypothetical protein